MPAEDRGACAQHILYIRLAYTHLFWILEPFSTLKGLAKWYLWPPKHCFHWARYDISQRSEMHISGHVVWYQAQRDSVTNVHPQLNTVPGDFFFFHVMVPRDCTVFVMLTAEIITPHPLCCLLVVNQIPCVGLSRGAVPPNSTWCL